MLPPNVFSCISASPARPWSPERPKDREPAKTSPRRTGSFPQIGHLALAGLSLLLHLRWPSH